MDFSVFHLFCKYTIFLKIKNSDTQIFFDEAESHTIVKTRCTVRTTIVDDEILRRGLYFATQHALIYALIRAWRVAKERVSPLCNRSRWRSVCRLSRVKPQFARLAYLHPLYITRVPASRRGRRERKTKFQGRGWKYTQISNAARYHRRDSAIILTVSKYPELSEFLYNVIAVRTRTHTYTHMRAVLIASNIMQPYFYEVFYCRVQIDISN